MTYEDFKVGAKYEVIANPRPDMGGYYQSDFAPGEIVEFLGYDEMIREGYAILEFRVESVYASVRYYANGPEPDWSKYFREVNP